MSTPPFESLLVANRGEIAVRVLRACSELGLRGIAIYSDADADGLHVREADEAVHIGPAEAAQSYLNIERVLAAAKQSGAKAIHPGYGFLAENATFAEAVIAAGIAWIGPSPAAMRAMGNKAEARDLVEKAGVPVLPGYQGSDEAAALKKGASEIGFPLLVKAAAGGGGVGQRVVETAGELAEAVDAARREAKAAFGDERLILEKYLPIARHIEFQVLGDQHGNLLHLFERECSLQRRRQKIVEESPSPLLDDALRQQMAAAALAAAGAVGYTNAGTVEFLVDPKTREFYFLEMNTRLQVEHPVTELVCGLDMVQWQIRIAAGEALPFAQKDLLQSGHAMEVRIYAEDPANHFLPQAGRVHRLVLPNKARVDNGVGEGATVGVHYDPLLSKIIVHAADRAAAITSMRSALQETAFLGLTTNLEFLIDLLADVAVQSGEIDTGLVERTFAGWAPNAGLPVEAVLAAAIVDLQAAGASAGSASAIEGDPYSPWAQASGFRIGGRV
jgi:acetyl/propionyl-CoA carboxylase alpha subunit